jgi:hypothetical protein
VHDLNAGREDHDVDAPRRNGGDRRFQRPDVLGQCPAIDGYPGDAGAALGQAIQQLDRRDAVLLHGDSCTAQRLFIRSRVDGRQQFAPGIRLGHADPDRHLHLTKHGERFGAARHDPGTAERLQEVGACIRVLNGADEGARANPSQEDDHLDVPAHDGAGKFQRRRVGLERHLAKRRRHERCSAIGRDQGGDLRGSTALQSEDTQSAKVGRSASRAHRTLDHTIVTVLDPRL